MKRDDHELQAADRPMVWSVGPDLACDYVSRAWVEFTGCEAEDALGEGWTHEVHPDDLVRWLQACVRAFDQREPFEIDYRLRRRDGEYRWVRDRAEPRYAGDGELTGYVCRMEIKEQRRAQESDPPVRERIFNLNARRTA